MIDPEEDDDRDEPEPRFILDDEEQEDDAQLNDRKYQDWMDKQNEPTKDTP